MPAALYLSARQVIRLHDHQVEAYGGVPGLRDEGLLLSALAQPGLEVFGEPAHPALSDKAAAYLFHLVKNHAFHDANKRTALHTALVFLHLNGQGLRASDDDLFALVLACATNAVDKAALGETLAAWMEPR